MYGFSLFKSWILIFNVYLQLITCQFMQIISRIVKLKLLLIIAWMKMKLKLDFHTLVWVSDKKIVSCNSWCNWRVIRCCYLLLSDWSIRLVWALWCVGGGLVEGLWRMKILCFLPIILPFENQTMWKEMSASECPLVFFALLVISILCPFLFTQQCH